MKKKTQNVLLVVLYAFEISAKSEFPRCKRLRSKFTFKSYHTV